MSNVVCNKLGGFPRSIYQFFKGSNVILGDQFGQRFGCGINCRYLSILQKKDNSPSWRSFFGRKKENLAVICTIDLHYEVKDLKVVGWRMLVLGRENLETAMKWAHEFSRLLHVNISVEINSEKTIYQSESKKLQKYLK